MKTSKTSLISTFEVDSINLNPNEAYINFINALKQVAEECIPLKPKAKHEVLWKNEIVEEKQCLKKIPSRANIIKYRRALQGFLLTNCKRY